VTTQPQLVVITETENNMAAAQDQALSVITGATGTISKLFRQHLSNMTGQHNIKELQKMAILGTAH
jgi:hypothetical protein